jgi:glycosyltransferase involved in cell wall biosynthesis
MPPPGPTFDVTVSIATYDRVALLERTINSCLSQQNALGLTYEILVTDNHLSGNAEPLVLRMASTSAVPIRYQREVARNMSVLRNAGIKNARGAYVVFIDDDEYADPDWLDQLMGAIRRTGADIAVGPRLAVFSAGRPPAFDPKARFFERNYDLEPDALIALVGNDGRPLYGLGTGNAMFRAETCFRDAEPFSLAFGDANGEDIEFFMRQYLEGRTIVWAARARVTEVVADHRIEIAYRLVRARRETQIYVSVFMEHAKSRRRTWLSLMSKGVAQVVLGSLITLFTWEFGSRSRLKGRLMTINGLGKLSWRNPVGYIDEDSFKTGSRA